MGSAGIYGFRVNGEETLVYSENGSYPDSLGVQLAEELMDIMKNEGLGWLASRIPHMEPMDVDDYRDGSHYQKARLYAEMKGFSDDGNIRPYVLYRKYPNNPGFGEAGLFCEWGYIINLDDMVLEFYKGGFTEKPTTGMFKDSDYTWEIDGKTYYPMHYIAEYRLEVPTLTELANETWGRWFD